jgi:tetratricopeptide (TPR) repeat protein
VTRLGSLTLAACLFGSLAACSGPTSRPPLSSAERLNGEGVRRRERGDNEGAEAFFRDALREAELVDDLTSQAAVWSNLGALASARGDAAEAWALHARALRLHLESGVHGEGEIRTRTNLAGAMLQSGKTAEAKAQFTQAIALASELHLPANMARVGLGSVALREGDGKGAVRLADDVAGEARRAGDQSSLSAALSLAGAASEFAGDPAQASARYEEALALDRTREQPLAITDDLHALSRLAEARGDRRVAASLLERSAAVARRLGRLDAAEADLVRALALLDGGSADDAAMLRAELEAVHSARNLAPMLSPR